MTVEPHRGDNTCIIRFRWSTDTYQKLNNIPGFKRWINRDIIFKATGATVLYLSKHFPDIEWKNGTERFIDSALAELRVSEELKARKLIDFPEAAKLKDYTYKTMPMNHQHRAFMLSRDAEVYAYFMEPGSGKTKVSLDKAAYMFAKGLIDTVCIVSVNNGHRKWVEDEVPQHLPDLCRPICYCHSPSWDTSHSLLRFREVLRARQRLRFFSFNIEAFSAQSAGALERFEATLGPRTLLILDESTRIKNVHSIRTKYLIEQGAKAGYRLILTGTPVTRGAEDLYPQFLFLDPYILGFETYTAFKNQYCIINRFRAVTGYQNQEELTSKIDAYSFRVLKSECMDLPPKIYAQWKFDLSPAQKKVYDDLAKEYVAEFQGDTLTQPLALARHTRLQQVACGWWPYEEINDKDGKVKWAVRPIEDSKHNPRYRALIGLMEELPVKKILWSRFKADLDFLSTPGVLPGKWLRYRGLDDARAFQNDPEINLIANPASAGIAIDLYKAQAMIFYSTDSDLEKRLQAEDRGHRKGLEGNGLLIYDIMARGTVDVKAIRALRNHKNVAEEIMGDPESFFLRTKEED